MLAVMTCFFTYMKNVSFLGWNIIAHRIGYQYSYIFNSMKLDYHPGGNAKQPNIHGNDYWKVYRTNSNGEDIVYGRIGHGGFENYDLIKDSPVYVDGVLVNGGM
ncbi:hypothetical protein [Salmonella enterica]|uniref:hypothetical protein n=1 Tax=Salmonella enterica TaxID=28901 RepID=UPI00331456AA